MQGAAQLVGRVRERAELTAAAENARASRGGLLLVSGESGVGKTRLVQEGLGASELRVLGGEATQGTTPPYGPVIACLREYLRATPGGLAGLGPLGSYLALLLPELGTPPPASDRAALVEVVRRAFEEIGRHEPTAVFLDDLHWADETTLVEVLPALSSTLADQPVLLLGAYRSDEIPRGHPLRRLRRELRRGGRLREIALEPLGPDETAILVARVLGEEPGRALAAQLYDRTQGVPFFVEELAAALVASNRLRRGKSGLELAGSTSVPVPDTVREAVFLRVEGVSEEARRALEVAAVAGSRFDADVVCEIAGEPAVEELLECGVLVEVDAERAAFRHALMQEAIYHAVPWTRRRAYHRRVAETLSSRGAEPSVVAEHWLAAREPERARPELLAALDRARTVHAYRDALDAGRKALELWPEGVDDKGRLELVVHVGACAELCGKLVEAVQAWREASEIRHVAGDSLGFAEAQRRLANAYALQGAHDLELAARKLAATTFNEIGRPADAAEELLAAAAHLDSAGRLATALPLVSQARDEAERSGRRDLVARALGIEGTLAAKLGHLDKALATSRAALDLALAENVTRPAADTYQRLANVLENAGDIRGAETVYRTAFDFCDSRGARVESQVCLICIAFILWQTGEWDRMCEIDREILRSPEAPVGLQLAAKQHLAFVAAARGDRRRARRLLDESAGYGEQHERERWLIWELLANAWAAELDGNVRAAADICAVLLERWGESESLHYPVPALRWATTFLTTHDEPELARACAAAVGRLASATSNPEALAALAHTIGETALLDGDPERARNHFENAIELLRPLEMPFETAQTQLRAGVAHAAAGEQEAALARLSETYRIARKLGARPLAQRAAEEVARLGEQVERRLGRKAAARLDGPGLTRRELEVVNLVALGRTNREIARELFLSTRTVDMHVRNAYAKLDCRSRAEATRRAAELGLLR